MPNIVSGNFKISKQQKCKIYRIVELKKEINELRQKHWTYWKRFKRQGTTQGTKFRKYRESCTGRSIKNEDKLPDLDDQTRWNNLRIHCIKERLKETSEDCEKQLNTLSKEVLDIEEEVVIKGHTEWRQIRTRKVIPQKQLFAEF